MGRVIQISGEDEPVEEEEQDTPADLGVSVAEETSIDESM